MRSISSYTSFLVLSFLTAGVLSSPAIAQSTLTLHDLIWVWGNPEMGEEGAHTAATFAQATPAERAHLLGASNVIMAGLGLPHDNEKAKTLSQEVARFPRLVWEIGSDAIGEGSSFVYDDTIARLGRLRKEFPQIEGVLLDDMSSLGIDAGFKPEHIRQVRELVSRNCPGVQTWGVVYTMNLNRRGIERYIRELDVLNLWTWHAKDIVDIEKNVAHCRQSFPNKPIVLGLYLYDYGDNRRMPLELLEKQCATALKLAEAGDIRGIVFLTINNDPDTVGWAADWIKRAGH